MSSSQAFCLRWNNFQSNMLDVFERLFHDERFVDVTLACEGQLIKAHKMVLSASSSYFQEIFTTTPCPHPVIIMKDVPLKELRKILEFMYKGEINVSKPEIGPLLVVAGALHVRGLAQIESTDDEPQPSTSNTQTSNESRSTAKLNRLLKRRARRTSSVESLVLIEEESQSQPAKQVKLTNTTETSTKAAAPEDSLIDDITFGSLHATDDDFLDNADYETSEDFDPIAIENVQIKNERDDDIISNYSTDNGSTAWDLLEKNYEEKFPECVKRLLLATGFDTLLSLSEITEPKITTAEHFLTANRHHVYQLDCCYSEQYKNMMEFEFLPGHKSLILSIPNIIFKIKEENKEFMVSSYADYDQATAHNADTDVDAPTQEQHRRWPSKKKNRTANEIKFQLIRNLVAFLAKIGSHYPDDTISEANIHDFGRDTDDEGKIIFRCYFSCPFCSKTIPITYKKFWMSSNATGHLKLHAKNWQAESIISENCEQQHNIS